MRNLHRKAQATLFLAQFLLWPPNQRLEVPWGPERKYKLTSQVGDLNSVSAFGQKFQQVHLCLPGTSHISGVAWVGSRRRVVIVLKPLFAINNPSLPLCRLTGFITLPAKNSKSVPQPKDAQQYLNAD